MLRCDVKNCILLLIIINQTLLVICITGGPMIATRNGLSRSLHVDIYVIMSFLYTLLFLYVVCCQNKIILILILKKNPPPHTDVDWLVAQSKQHNFHSAILILSIDHFTPILGFAECNEYMINTVKLAATPAAALLM